MKVSNVERMGEVQVRYNKVKCESGVPNLVCCRETSILRIDQSCPHSQAEPATGHTAVFLYTIISLV